MNNPITQHLIPVEFASALCAQVSPEMWFPEAGASSRDAKKICNRCVHITDCLEGALEREEQFGIYGGTSAYERNKILRTRRLAVK